MFLKFRIGSHICIQGKQQFKKMLFPLRMSWKRERGEENLKVILERRETGGDRGEKKERRQI